MSIQVNFSSLKKNNLGIQLTSSAANRVNTFMQNQKDCIGLRVGIKQMGCSGLGYEIDFTNEKKKDDITFSDKDITIIVERKNLVFLDGTEIDFVNDGINQAFKFNNPNATGACGCGDSFTIN